ncbi:MAG: hypothetical protein B6I26_05545 [Desulfobacteraceae bacterium 4572_130]|nr:MAG: hypothetical protein B6I26_05545 [Desulfobacteraceae bacterium 4572_130]
MPGFKKKYMVLIKIIFLGLFLVIFLSFQTFSNQGINLYYIKYDIQSSKNKIIKTNFIMVPAQHKFRLKNFKTISLKGSSFTFLNNSTRELIAKSKENAFKLLLEKNGLKSVKSFNNIYNNTAVACDTVVSYEGAIKTPIKIINYKYDKNKECFFLTMEVQFAATAFPDKWNTLELKNKIKQYFYDFLSFFH